MKHSERDCSLALGNASLYKCSSKHLKIIQDSLMHIPNAKCCLIVIRFFFFFFKDRLEISWPYISNFWQRFFFKLTLINTLSKIHNSDSVTQCSHLPGLRSFLGYGTFNSKSREVLSKLKWSVILFHGLNCVPKIE